MMRESDRKWRAANPEKCKQSMKAATKRWALRNPEKTRERKNRWRLANPDKVRESERKHKYGLTNADWEALFERQGRRCAVCCESKFGKRGPFTDHDHATGEVRGILCP